jgi:hypothetical protein
MLTQNQGVAFLGVQLAGALAVLLSLNNYRYQLTSLLIHSRYFLSSQFSKIHKKEKYAIFFFFPTLLDATVPQTCESYFALKGTDLTVV